MGGSLIVSGYRDPRDTSPHNNAMRVIAKWALRGVFIRGVSFCHVSDSSCRATALLGLLSVHDVTALAPSFGEP